MRKSVVGLLVISLLWVVPPAYAAKVTPGTSCKKAGAQESYNGRVYTCIKLGSKLYWDNGKNIVSTKSKLSITFRKDWSYCVPSFTPGNVQCSVWGLWTYSGNVPYDVKGNIYALADGKVFKAIKPQSQDEFSYADFTFSPGTKVKGGASFEFPVGVYVERIFIGNSYNWKQAIVSFEVKAFAEESGFN